MNNKEYFQKGLCDISELKTGWISGAPTIHQNIIDITQKLINELTVSDLENWSISPFVNGVLL